MTHRPSNIVRQLSAARELAAQAHAGMVESPSYAVIARNGEAEVAVHVVDNALRRLLLTQMLPLSNDDKLAFVAGMSTCLGTHIGRMMHGLPSDVVQQVVTRSTEALIQSLGADLTRTGVDVTLSSDDHRETQH